MPTHCLKATALLCLTALPLTGCGGASCPDGFEKRDGRCLPADGGPDGGPGDAALDGSCSAATYYRDDDGDGFGLEGDTMASCEVPDGYAAEPGDCNDTDDAIHPDAEEACNGLDDDCDETLDEGLEASTFYRDADGDGFGTPDETLDVCAAPEGWTDDDTDCDDSADAVSPDGTESCNDTDDDCDGATDEGLLTPVGEPKVLGSGAVDNSGAVGLAAYAGGYVAVWQRDDDRIVYELLDAGGGSLMGLPDELADTVSGGAQDFPVVAVVEDTRPPHAVVAWKEDGAIRARSIPLDGSALPAAVEAIPDAVGARVVASGTEAVVVASRSSGGTRSVLARRIDPETGTTEGDVATLLTWENPPALSYHFVSYVDEPSAGLLLGVADQRAGDLAPQGYVTRVALPSFEPSPMSLRLDPGDGRRVLTTTPTPLLETSDGRQPMVVSLAGSGAEATLEAVALTNEDPPAEDGSRVTLDPTGLVRSVDATARTAVAVYVDPAFLGDDPADIFAATLAPGRMVAPTPETWTSEPIHFEGVDVALRGDAEGAWIVAERASDTATESEVRWQALGCE